MIGWKQEILVLHLIFIGIFFIKIIFIKFDTNNSKILKSKFILIGTLIEMKLDLTFSNGFLVMWPIFHKLHNIILKIVFSWYDESFVKAIWYFWLSGYMHNPIH